MRKSQWQASFLSVLCRLVSPGTRHSFAHSLEINPKRNHLAPPQRHRDHREMQLHFLPPCPLYSLAERIKNPGVNRGFFFEVKATSTTTPPAGRLRGRGRRPRDGGPGHAW